MSTNADLNVIAITGDDAPGAEGAFDHFGVPVLNEAGQVGFTADLDPFTGTTLYRSTTEAHQLISPLSNAQPAINGRGQMLWKEGFGDTERIMRGDGGQPVKIAGAGDQAGDIASDVFAGDFSLPLFNDHGEAAFRVTLEGDQEPSGIYRSDGTETHRIGRTGSGFGLDRIDAPTGMNNAGQVVFTAHESGNTFDSVYRSTGVFVDLGDPLFPSGAEVATPGAQIVEVRPSENSEPLIQENGRVVFNSDTSTLESVPDFPYGAFHVNAAGNLQALALNEEGSPWQTIGIMAVNELGQSLMRGVRDDQPSSGYYLFGSSTGGTRPVFDTQNPPANDMLTQIDGVALSDGGHLAVWAHAASGEGLPSENAIHMIDTRSGVAEINGEETISIAVHEVARTGDALLDGEVADLFFAKAGHRPHARGVVDSPAVVASERSGVNERGQVAFWFELEDGREGIGLWSPPQMERVVDGALDLGLFHWQIEGPGAANGVELPSGELAGELLAGSPVTISQVLSTPDEPFSLSFDYQFTAADGALEIMLDGQTLEQLDAPSSGPMQDFATLQVPVHTMSGLTDVELGFTFEGPADFGVRLDDISLRAPVTASEPSLNISADGNAAPELEVNGPVGVPFDLLGSTEVAKPVEEWTTLSEIELHTPPYILRRSPIPADSTS